MDNISGYSPIHLSIRETVSPSPANHHSLPSITHAVHPCGTGDLVAVLAIDMLASHLLEHAACAVGDLLVRLTRLVVPELLLHRVQALVTVVFLAGAGGLSTRRVLRGRGRLVGRTALEFLEEIHCKVGVEGEVLVG